MNQAQAGTDQGFETLLAREFQALPDCIYLNHAGISRLPLRSAAALDRHARRHAASGGIHYAEWIELEQRLRARVALLLGAAQASEIAFLENTSAALSLVAWGFPWTPGDNVVTSNQEYPANRLCWQSLAATGVETRLVELGADPEAALLAACDGRTRLLAISAVEFATGIRFDLERLGTACAQRGIAFCVDAIQALGVVPIDVARAHIDFLAAGCHKWLMGPEGLAVFYCAPAWLERLRLHQFGAHMTSNPTDFEAAEWHPAADARRFECGTLNRLGMTALDASLSLGEDLGWNTIHERVRQYADVIVAAVQANPWLELVTPPAPDRRAGIVTFRGSGRPQNGLYEALRAAGVWGSPRAGGVRLAPHVSNTRAEMEQIEKIIKTL